MKWDEMKWDAMRWDEMRWDNKSISLWAFIEPITVFMCIYFWFLKRWTFLQKKIQKCRIETLFFLPSRCSQNMRLHICMVLCFCKSEVWVCRLAEVEYQCVGEGECEWVGRIPIPFSRILFPFSSHTYFRMTVWERGGLPGGMQVSGREVLGSGRTQMCLKGRVTMCIEWNLKSLDCLQEGSYKGFEQICTCIYMYIYIHIYVCVFVCVGVHIYYRYVHIYVWIKFKNPGLDDCD